MGGIDRIAQGMGYLSKTRPLKALGNAWNKSPEDVLAWATVASIVLKDGIGCAMYVTQSLNNKKIPDEKRKFVAALDLTNGGLMILAQIALFFLSRQYSGKIFKKIFAKSFNEVAKNQTIARLQMNAAKAGKGFAKYMKLEKVFDKVEKNGKDLFKFLFDIAAATIVGKRVIVPLIATPFAKKVENWMGKKDDKSSETAKEVDTAAPVMTGNEARNQASGPTNLIEKYKQNYGK